MTIITIATVGFQEVHPLSDVGRVFTAFLIIFSFGIFAYAVTTFTRYIVDGIFRNYYKDNKVKKRIRKLKNHVIICGYGRNGKQAVANLREHKEGFVIIEKNESLVEKFARMNRCFILKVMLQVMKFSKPQNLKVQEH